MAVSRLGKSGASSRWLRGGLLAVAAGLSAGLSHADESSAVPPGVVTPAAAPFVPPAEAAEWVKQLDAPDYVLREQAQEKLTGLGPAAATWFQGRLATVQAEGAVRAASILAAWYEAATPEASEPVESAIAALDARRIGAVNDQLAGWKQEFAQTRQERAVAALRRLGAGVHELSEDEKIASDRGRNPFAVSSPPYILIGNGWKGGDDGLKFIERTSDFHWVYRVKTAPVSEKAIQALQAARPDLGVEVRGAFLGISGAAHELGCQISTVRPGAPAARAGLEVEDVIVKFDDVENPSFPKLIEMLGERGPGEKCTIEVLRGREILVKTVELGDWH